MDADFLLPWEHKVCQKCFYHNPHAIWLVKYGCFQQFLHEDAQKATVVIVHDTMEMIKVRPLPRNWSKFDGDYILCQFKNNCKRRNMCLFPHSKAEQDTWNAKKTILNGMIIIHVYS